MTTEFLEDLKKSLESICKNIQQSIDQKQNTDGKRTDKVSSGSGAIDKDLKFFLHVCEVKKLHDIYGKVANLLEIIQHKQ